jgi:Fe-S cluster assembly iron-binding protein IscA
MSEQVIKLSQNAAERIKDIMSKAEKKTIGVRVGVQIWRLCRHVLHHGIR